MRAILAAVFSIAVSFTLVIGLGFWIRRQTSAVSDTLSARSRALPSLSSPM